MLCVLSQVYALPFSDPSENLPGVYNYLINCANVPAKPIQFPKQYGQWKEGCLLHEPLDGHLQKNRASKGLATSFSHVYFKVMLLSKQHFCIHVLSQPTFITIVEGSSKVYCIDMLLTSEGCTPGWQNGCLR